MDLKKLDISDVASGVSKALVCKASDSIDLGEDANVLIDIYGYMICYHINVLNLISFVESERVFTQKHVEAVRKYC